MKSFASWWVVGVIWLGFPAALAAQAGDPAAAGARDAFVELRASEELAADGIVLARLGVALDVETAGTRMLITLVDVDTRAARAATKLEPVPDDPEATVASVVQIVATLTTQLVRPDLPAPAPPPARPVADPEARRARLVAQRRYDAEAITFRDDVSYWRRSGSATTEVRRDPQPYLGTGPTRRRLDREQFYLAIERPDLNRTVSRRRTLGGIGFVAATVTFSVGAYLALTSEADTTASGACMASALAIGLGSQWLLSNSDPVTDAELQRLAHEHNAKLRAKYGLAPAGAALAPFVTTDGAGVALAGGF